MPSPPSSSVLVPLVSVLLFALVATPAQVEGSGEYVATYSACKSDRNKARPWQKYCGDYSKKCIKCTYNRVYPDNKCQWWSADRLVYVPISCPSGTTRIKYLGGETMITWKALCEMPFADYEMVECHQCSGNYVPDGKKCRYCLVRNPDGSCKQMDTSGGYPAR